MKFCSKCGYQNEGTVAYCASCGAAFESHAQPQNPYYGVSSQPTYGQQMPQQPKPILSTNPVLNAVKTAGSSTVFLVASILFSALLFFNLIAAFTPNSALVSILANSGILSELGLSRLEVYSILSGLSEVTPAASVIVLIQTLFICIGLWLFYASSRNARDNSVKTTGLTMIKVVTIFTLISILALPVLFLIWLLFSSVSTDYHPFLSALVAVSFIIVSAMALLPVLYFVFILKAINTVKRTIATGVPSSRVSGFVPVMNFILAGVTLLSSFTVGGVAVISALCNGTFLILISIAIFAYKKSMLALSYGNGIPQAAFNQAAVSAFQPQYGQSQYGQSQYGQPQYGQPQYGQSQYGQSQYEQPQYEQPQYEQPQVEDTVVLNETSVVFCSSCGKQYNALGSQCPHCGVARQ